mgnify:CR=1 FL=1
MQQFLEDVRVTIGKVETFEKTNKIYINGIPFVPVKQSILDDFRKKGIYDKYILALKIKIMEEVDKIVAERKTSVDIEEILNGGQVDTDWK